MNFSGSRGFFSSIPVVTKNLLIINLLFWLASIMLPTITMNLFHVRIDLNEVLGMHYWQANDFNLYQMVTYMFMHASFSHIFFNMFAVFMFGRILEQYWGPKRFLIFYMVSGIGAGIVQQIVWTLSFLDIYQSTMPMMMSYGEMFNNVITIGASGSVFGILLGFAMIFPNMPLYIMFIPIPIKAKYVMIGYGVIELYSGVAGRVGDNVAHFAHLGGMLFGWLLILYWRKRR